ncbi:MAG: twin-arginine translocation signal domain-containing protein, partial [Anaerolineae bacterium]|nr:twin-arginine translocation signal domain-containing protein [Anaerolineae bacterium]
MTTISRRNFIRLGAAAAGGLALGQRLVLPQAAW